MGSGQRRLAVVADLLVELVVVLLRDVFFGPRPERRRLVYRFPLAGGHHLTRLVVFAFFPFFLGHQDGQRNVVGIFVDDGLELPGVQVLAGIGLQVQDDTGAALGAFNLADLELARAFTAPAHALAGGQTGAAAFHRDAVGHDEARIKAHTELADQLRIVFLVARELGHELARAALGNRSQMLNRLLLRQADAVVGDGQRFGSRVKAHAHLQIGIVFIQRRVIEPLKTQLVAGVRGIGDQLTQEDVGVGVERMRDQLEQLGDFGLEGKGLLVHCGFECLTIGK